MKRIDKVPTVIIYHFVMIEKIATLLIYHFRALCVEGTRMRGAKNYIFLDLIGIVSLHVTAWQ